MTRLFLEKTVRENSVIHLTGEKARYLSAVIRCRPDDIIIVTDSTGTAYSARISAVAKKQISLEIQSPIHQDNESSLEIILLQGLLKGEKMDLVIQKTTELGVTEILPMITERSQVRETRKLQRWQKIAEEASRQCGRNKIPQIHEPAPFKEALASREPGRGLIFWEKEGSPFSSALTAMRGQKRVILCIGPEGGFSENEISIAADNNYVVTSIGKRILRAETAAIVTSSVTQFVLGDLSGQE